MNNNQHNCKILEDEIKEFWPQWRVIRQISKGTFGSVFEICKEPLKRFYLILPWIKLIIDYLVQRIFLVVPRAHYMSLIQR